VEHSEFLGVLSGHEVTSGRDSPPIGWPEWIPDRDELPAHTTVFTTGRATRFAVLIPVINEGERILGQLRGMRDANLGVDLIIVDGGSTDGSMEPTRLRGELGVTALLVKTGPGKLSAQLRLGFAWGLSQGYEGFVTIDGNGKDDFRAIPSFLDRVSHGFDYIQGSRYLAGGIAENTPIDRELAVRFLHAPLISLGAGFRYTDTTNGFRCFSKRLLLDDRVRPFRDVFDTYNLHYYLAVRAARLNFKVGEIPVARRYPSTGVTPSKIGGLRGKLHILKQSVLAILGAYNPK
jgi:dolichol-phosphate mannosyltransferase